MIKSFFNKNFILTLDFKLRELRLVNLKDKTLNTIPLNNDDIEGYDFLSDDIKVLLKSLRLDIKRYTGIKLGCFKNIVNPV